MSERHHKLDVINNIERYLNESRNKDDITKIYFSVNDNDFTEFGVKSNNLEIGVISANETEGLVLLCLLRMIIDNYYKQFDEWNSYFDTEWKYNDVTDFDWFIEEVSLLESYNMMGFNLDDNISRKLVTRSYDINGCYYDDGVLTFVDVTKTLNEIDIYTLPRIMKKIKNKLK